MPDIVRPLKLENPSSGGTQTNLFPTETNVTEDYLGCAGVSFKGSSSILLDYDSNNELRFKDPVSGQHLFRTLKSIDLSTLGTNNPFVTHNNSTFRAAANFYFRGTNELATPSAIKVIVNGSASNTNWEFKLYDVTNAQTIALQSGTGTAFTPISPSTSNWPAAEAILELQIRRIAGSGNTQLYGMSIIW